MKISIDQHILLKPLEQAEKFVSTKNTIPILSAILIQADHEGLTITGGDGFQFLKSKVCNDDLQVILVGKVTLSSKKIVEIVRKMKGVVDIEARGNEVIVSNGSKTYDLENMDSDEYPQFKGITEDSSIKIEGKTILSLIRETAYAAHDKEDNPILTGLRLRIQDNNLSLTGTNRHRLSFSTRSIESQNTLTTVISAKSLSELAKLISTNEVIDISLHDSEFHVQTSGFVFYSRILEGNYPEVDKIVPNHFATSLVVNKDSFLDALDGAFIIVKDEKQKLIRMTVNDKIELKSKASGVGKASEFIKYETINGEGFKVSFNGAYVIDAIKSISSEQIWIGYTGNMGPMIFKDTSDERNYRVVLPYRTMED